MSKVYKCDRCGSIFDTIPNTNGSIVLGTLSNINQVEINYETFSWTGRAEEKKVVNHSAQWVDLCPKCLDGLAEWFNGHAGEGEDNKI